MFSLYDKTLLAAMSRIQNGKSQFYQMYIGKILLLYITGCRKSLHVSTLHARTVNYILLFTAFEIIDNNKLLTTFWSKHFRNLYPASCKISQVILSTLISNETPNNCQFIRKQDNQFFNFITPDMKIRSDQLLKYMRKDTKY